MTIRDYKAAVKSLLLSDAATDEMWDQALFCILRGSEDFDLVPAIDAVVYPQGKDVHYDS